MEKCEDRQVAVGALREEETSFRFQSEPQPNDSQRRRLPTTILFGVSVPPYMAKGASFAGEM